MRPAWKDDSLGCESTTLQRGSTVRDSACISLYDYLKYIYAIVLTVGCVPYSLNNLRHLKGRHFADVVNVFVLFCQVQKGSMGALHRRIISGHAPLSLGKRVLFPGFWSACWCHGWSSAA